MAKLVNTGISSLLSLAICIVSIDSSQSIAQETQAERGRLPDGRAFRTDSDGAQLIDYIAELEQNIAEQNRKIISLEDENSNIKSDLTRIKAGRSDQLQEKDLVKTASKNSKLPETDSFTIDNCPSVVPAQCPRVESRDCPVCPEIPDLKAIRAEGYLEKEREQNQVITGLKLSLDKITKERDYYLKISQRSVEVPKCPDLQEVLSENDSEKQTELHSQISNLETQLEELTREKDRFVKLSQQPIAIQKCPDSPDLEAIRVNTDSEKQALLRKEVSHLEQELVKARLERDRFSAIVQQVSTQDKKESCASDSKQEMRASFNPDLESSRHNVVDLIKSRIKKELQLLESRKDERDVLFEKYTRQHQGIGIMPSPLRAKSGLELSHLGELLSKAETVRELTVIRNDLEEIRKQMTDDLVLVERMSKLSS